MGDPGGLARGTPGQTALQDWSWRLGLAPGLFRFRGLRQKGSSVRVQVRGPQSLCWLLRCWAGLGWAGLGLGLVGEPCWGLPASSFQSSLLPKTQSLGHLGLPPAPFESSLCSVSPWT